jgi:hypothetical protein
VFYGFISGAKFVKKVEQCAYLAKKMLSGGVGALVAMEAVVGRSCRSIAETGIENFNHAVALATNPFN